MSIVKINGKPYKFTEHENELIKKNGHEDLAKAKFYVDRVFDLWEG